MPEITGQDAALKRLLSQSRAIAVVGHSNQPSRTSYQIAQFLRNLGYRVYPVNPMLTEIEGQPCFARLQDVPEPIDIVNVFRRPDRVPEVVEAAIAVGAKAVWMQLGVSHAEAAQRAIAAGLDVVMDACIKLEYQRLGVTRS